MESFCTTKSQVLKFIKTSLFLLSWRSLGRICGLRKEDHKKTILLIWTNLRVVFNMHMHAKELDPLSDSFAKSGNITLNGKSKNKRLSI